MKPRHHRLLESLLETARASMPPHEAGRFEADLRRMFGSTPARSRKDLEREALLLRHCPAQLPPVTIDQAPRRPAARARRRRRHTWKQLRLL